MPLKQGHGVGKPEISVVVGIGVGVAAVAGLAAGAALGSGMLAVASSRRGAKPALRPEDVRWDAEGRIENWTQILKIIQLGVSPPYVLPFKPCAPSHRHLGVILLNSLETIKEKAPLLYFLIPTTKILH